MKKSGRVLSNSKGFTIIELLVVIAIIAILAAILFPVFGRVREQTRQAQTMSNMHNISTALKLYKEDYNKYPAALLGFVQYYDTVNNVNQFYTGTGTPLAVEALAYRPLSNGQKYLKDKYDFACPDEKIKALTATTSAVYPPTVGSAFANQQVVFTPLMRHNMGKDADPNFPLGGNVFFYTYDAMDIGPQLDATGQPVMPETWELHYSIDWTGQTGPADAAYPNQLKYTQVASPDQTVVTWVTDHAAYANSDKVLVLLLNGTTKAVDSKVFVKQGPLNYAH